MEEYTKLRVLVILKGDVPRDISWAGCLATPLLDELYKPLQAMFHGAFAPASCNL